MQHNRTTVPPRTNCEVSHAKCFEVPAASTVVSACRLQQDEPRRVRTDGSNSDDQFGTDECDSRVLSGFGPVSACRLKRAVVTGIVGKCSLTRGTTERGRISDPSGASREVVRGDRREREAQAR